MTSDEVSEILARPLAQDLLNGPDPAHIAYVGTDGDPRVVPVVFWSHGLVLHVATLSNTPKVAALRAHPNVAISIDRGAAPPRELLLRGVATIELVQGAPPGYLAAARKMMTAAEHAGWKARAIALYEGEEMAVITVTITWAKLIDFETTAPTASEELFARKGLSR